MISSSKGYVPSIKILQKLAGPEAKPRGGITLQDLLLAAGFTDRRIDWEVNEEEEEEEDNPAYEEKPQGAPSDSSQKRKADRREDERREWRIKREQFEKTARASLLLAFSAKGILATEGNIREIETGYRPSYLLKILNGPVSSWWFEFAMARPSGEHYDVRNQARRILEKLIFAVVDEKVNLSVVVDDIALYETLCSYKGRISFRGNLSVMVIDSAHLEVVAEQTLSLYFPDQDEEALIRLI